jgi:hypothetical protein
MSNRTGPTCLLMLLLLGCAASEGVPTSGASGGDAGAGPGSTSGAGGSFTTSSSGDPTTTSTTSQASSSASAGVGGSGGTAPTGCTYPPTNSPVGDPTGLEPGPVVKFTVHVYYMKEPDDTVVDPIPEGDHWIAPVGNKIVFDATQKNDNNKPCQWQSEPVYEVWDDACSFERLNTTNPFLLQMKANAPGTLHVKASIDGVTSNEVVLIATP